jgi:hypothetical protein
VTRLRDKRPENQFLSPGGETFVFATVYVHGVTVADSDKKQPTKNFSCKLIPLYVRIEYIMVSSP